MNLPVAIFYLILLADLFTSGTLAQQTDQPKVPINVVQKAIQFVIQSVSDPSERLRKLQELDEGNATTLYEVAKDMNRNSNHDDTITSMEIWHALADAPSDGHVLSQVALGFAYSENDKRRAIAYFEQAGEAGPHQSSLYNAGRLLADPEVEEFVKALGYLRAAYALSESHPKYATDHLTETSRYAYERLSEQLVAVIQESLRSKGSVLSIQEAVDMFLYANLDDYPLPSSKEEKTWQQAMQVIQAHQWDVALIQFDKLEQQSTLSSSSEKSQLSTLQLALLHILKVYVKAGSEINRGIADL